MRKSNDSKNMHNDMEPSPSKEVQHFADSTDLNNRLIELEIRETSLRKEKQYFLELRENSPFGCQTLDANGCLIEINQAWLDILGFTREEVIGKNFAEFLHSEWRDDFKEKYTRFNAAGEISDIELQMVKKDGLSVVVSLQGRIGIASQGRLPQAYCLLQDITRQKQAESRLVTIEQRYRTILMAAMDGFMVADQNGRILEANETYLKMSGYSEQELLTMSLTDLEAKESREETAARIRKIVTDGEARFESKHHRKDGSQFDVEIRVQYSPTNDGSLVAFIRDITERKSAEGERKNIQKQLQQAQRLEAIGTLAGGIAHDFNNLLGVMIGFTDMVLDDVPQGSRIRKDLEKVLQAGYRGKDLVGQVLAFSRQSKEECISLQLRAIIKEVLKMLRASLPSTIQIKQKLDARCGLVEADPSHMHQILMNLCTNAYHAMEENGGVLTIEFRPALNLPINIHRHVKAEGKKYVELIIRDTGHGIPADIIDLIFDPFFTTKPKGKGTGMGLSIAYGIVQKYEGTIKVESVLGSGTAFHVFLPESGQQVLDSPVSQKYPSVGKEHILFIDDEQLLVEMGQTMLERLGYKVTAVTDSRKALDLFSESPDDFDLVITDQTMPEITGLELAKAMLRIRETLPIILCTGYSSHVNEEVAQRHGVRSFLFKPLIKGKLAQLLREILGDY